MQVTIDLTHESDEEKRDEFDTMSSQTSSPLEIIPIVINQDVTHEVDCQSPRGSQDLCHEEEHDEELYQMSTYFRDQGHGSMKLRLCSSTREKISHYDFMTLENGDLVDFELGPNDRSMTIGRKNYINLLDKPLITYLGIDRLSSLHCLIEWIAEKNDASLYVTDLSSTNGTVVNSTRILPNVRTQLFHGDIIRLAFIHDRPEKSCKIQYEVVDPIVSRIETPHRSPAFALGHNVMGILFAGPLCYFDGPKLRSHETLNFRDEYEGLKKSLSATGKQAWGEFNEAGVTMVHAAPSIDVSVNFATMDSLHMMVSSKCRVLHFSGHGSVNCLYFESDDLQGLADPIPYSTLVQILRSQSQLHLRLVVVNSCNSEHVAKAFVDCGVPHVVAIRGDTTVEDCEAVHFTQSFYLNLTMGKLSVEECFREALMTLSYSPHCPTSPSNRGTRKFTLLPETDSHYEIIFPSKIVPKSLALEEGPEFPHLWQSSLPALCHNFRYRSIEQLRICGYLTNEDDDNYKRWIWLTGSNGIGKTQLANACAAYLSPRMAFLGGVFWIDIPSMLEADKEIGVCSGHHIYERLYDKIEGKIETFRKTAHRRMQRTHKLTRHIHGFPMLVVVDGCDVLLSDDANMLINFLNCRLMDNIGLKIITTSVYCHQTDKVHNHGLYHFDIPRMTRKASARILVDMIFPRKLSIHELKRSTCYKTSLDDTQENVLVLLAAHPIIQKIRGIPRTIFQQAELLRSNSHATVDSLID